MRVIYKMTDGIAHDVQFVRSARFVLPDGWLETTDDKPHTVEALSDPKAWAARQAAKSAPQLSGEDVLALLTQKGVVSAQEVAALRAGKRA